MLKFYLNEREIQVETNSTVVSTLDKTFDAGTIILEWNNVKNAIFPKTILKIVDTTNNETWKFIVIQDTVSIVKKAKNIVYAHTLTIQQDTSEMQDHILRNTIFQQIESESKDITTLAIGYANVKKIGSTFSLDGQVHLPIKSYTPDITAYKRERIHVASDEKVANVVIDIETTATSYTELQKTTKLLLVHPRAIVKNIHARTYLKVNYYANEDDEEPTDYYEFSIPKGEKTVIIPKDFFVENGAGWYEVALDEDTDFRIDTDKFPSNSISFVINGSTLVENVDYPTVCFSFKANIHFNIYKYSLWDILDTIKKQTEKVVNGVQRVASPYLMPNKAEGNGLVLDSIIAPEFTFTGKDLYSCVAEVMNYIDSIPTINENGEIDFEELNNNKNNLDSNIKFADKGTNITNENYVNRLVTNYQNGKQSTPVSSPAKNVFRRVSSNVYGVPSVNDYVMNLPYPIDHLQNVYISLDGVRKIEVELSVRIDYAGESTYEEVNFADWDFLGNKIDIKNAVVDSTLYEILTLNDPDSLTRNKFNTLPYNKGDTFINMGGKRQYGSGVEYESYKKAVQFSILDLLFIDQNAVKIGYSNLYDDLPSIENVMFNVVYFGIFNGQAAIESREPKYNGETFVAQSNGNIQLNRMGSNMSGLIARLGNEKDSVVLPCTSYGSRIKKGSRWEDENGNIWRVNTVKTTFSTKEQNVIVECEFSKNFNMNSEFTAIDQDYRLFEISNNLTSKGFENLNEIIYLSTTDHRAESQTIAFDDIALYHIFNDTLISSVADSQVARAVVECDYLKQDIPIHTYGLGNTICLEMGYEHPTRNTNILSDEPYLLGTRLVSKPQIYSKGYSKSLKFTIYGSSSTEVIDNAFPIYSAANYSSFTQKAYLDIEYYKKPNEIIHLNYGLSFLPYPIHETDSLGIVRTKTEQIYVGDKFISENAIIQNNGMPTIKNLHLFTSQNELYSVMDRKALGLDNGVAYVYVVDKKIVVRRNDETSITCKSWCLADEDGNIYIAVNEDKESVLELNIYYIPRQTRI